MADATSNFPFTHVAIGAELGMLEYDAISGE